jgi:hypothetical protein
LPLRFNNTISSKFLKEMSATQRNGVKKLFKDREVFKPYMETFFSLTSVPSSALRRQGINQHRGWLKPVVFETPSDIQMPENKAHPILVGNQIVAYFPFLMPQD